MNTTLKIKDGSFRVKTAIAVAVAGAVSAAAIVASIIMLPRPAEYDALQDTVANLEKSVSLQETISSSVIELSRLARRSGYQLAVRDVLKDHRDSMAAVRENLAVLKRHEGDRPMGALIGIVLVVIVAQGVFLFFFLQRFMNRVLTPIRLMSRQIDDVMTRKKVVLENVEKPGEIRDFYHKFEGLIKLVESEWEKNASKRSDVRHAGKSR